MTSKISEFQKKNTEFIGASRNLGIFEKHGIKRRPFSLIFEQFYGKWELGRGSKSGPAVSENVHKRHTCNPHKNTSKWNRAVFTKTSVLLSKAIHLDTGGDPKTSSRSSNESRTNRTKCTNLQHQIRSKSLQN